MAIQTITTKELRAHLPKIKKAVDRGQSFVLMYRSRPFAQLLPLTNKKVDLADFPAVGMWKQRISRAGGTKAFLDKLRKDAWR